MQVMRQPEVWQNEYRPRPEDMVEAPAVVRHRYTFREWWDAHKGQRWLRLRETGWREFGWGWYLRTYRWRAWRVLKASGLLPDVWRYARNRVWDRYNTVTARTLPPTWCDREELLLHAMFAVLCDFVEKEKPFGHFDTSYSHDAWYSIRDLYEWWTVRRPARELAEAAALMAWHTEFMRMGGFQSVPTDHPMLMEMQPPEKRGHDTSEADRLHARHMEMEEAGEAEDDAMMRRLVGLRGHLWT
jgi:hypothetical protein